MKPQHSIQIAGKDVALYPISTLAEALGRSSATIRKWEVAGIIPDCLFRGPMGRRLYTEEQIRIIVECAEISNVRSGYSIANTNFTPRVVKRLNELHEYYLANMNQ